MKRISKKHLLKPKRSKESHKGDSGRVLIIGGSEDFVGAPALAGISALRAGTDLVTVAAPEKVAWAISNIYPDLITKKLPGKILSSRHFKILKQMMEHSDVTLIGNGIGLAKTTQKLVRKLCALPGLKVIDADAIKAVTIQSLIGSILTPHSEELQILLENSGYPSFDDPEKIQQTLREHLAKNNTIILKGSTDYVITASEIYSNTTGNPGMTKGGTGDVLAGIVASYYAQTRNALDSSCGGVYIAGMLGDILFMKKQGFTYLASDLAEELKRFNHPRK